MDIRNKYREIEGLTANRNITRIANAVQCHNDCHESRFSIVNIVISVSNVTNPYYHYYHKNCHRKLSSKIVIKNCHKKLS